ncbi:PQQ-like beta-propeller repeat protein [Halolamina sp. CBA1230]|uniref:outer membrane protein assembly factor BamB family protein n=1 Tax=Halolamina sp. CBA1230 TaxID=1853690 RepID=UPI0011798F81|nr:PQQ-binding-like beta-propeller repeat protein [Halolamina sp. CBA1230]QKY20878.1 PQQ-like beta-propeller repeat protein [Halolamina sp. CBA1230]
MPSRRDLLAALGTGAALGFAGCAGGDCTPVEPDGIEWPHPGGGAANASALPDLTVPSRVAERWETTLAPEDGLDAFAGVVAGGDRLVALGRSGDAGFWSQFDVRSGERTAHERLPPTIAAPPVLADGHTVAVFQTSDGAHLRVLDSGDEVDHYSLANRPTMPRAADDVLFGGDADGAYAYAPGEGERWRQPFGDPEEAPAIPYPPAVDDERVYVPVVSSGDRGVYALDRANGEILWSVPDLRAFRAPARIGSLLFVPAKSELVALDAASGERQWTTPTLDDRPTFPPPAGVGEQLVLSDGSTIHGLGAETGEKTWSVDFESAGRPVVGGDTAVVSAGDTLGVVALALDDGSERWRLDDVSLAAPLGNGVLVKRRDDLIACPACEN